MRVGRGGRQRASLAKGPQPSRKAAFPSAATAVHPPHSVLIADDHADAAETTVGAAKRTATGRRLPRPQAAHSDQRVRVARQNQISS